MITSKIFSSKPIINIQISSEENRSKTISQLVAKTIEEAVDRKKI